MEKTVLNVLGMSCSHCERAITNELMELDGILSVKVSLKNKTVTVEYDSFKLSIETIKDVIAETGYEVK